LALAAGPAGAADDDKAQGGAGAMKRKVTQAESYVQVDPMYASIIDGNKPTGMLLVEISMDVPDPVLRQRVNEYMPLLRDAFVRSLAVYAANAVRTWRQPDIDDIATRMQKITDYVLGKQGAKVLMAQTAIRVNQ
jgi:flagellar basal body-associated protein FliL